MALPDWVISFFHSPPALLLVALLLEAFIPIPSRWKPSALRPLLDRLVKRVHHAYSSTSQQWITGVLLPSVVVVPSLIGSWSFRNLAPSDALFDVVLLMWLLESHSVKERLHAIQQLLKQKKIALARLQLGAGVLRDTQSLSEMGLCKAAIEMSLLRLVKQWLTVGFVYLLLGIHGALFYRLIQLIAQACNLKLPANRICGELSARLTQAFNLVPVYSIVLLQTLLPRGILAWKTAFRQFRLWPDLISGLVLIHTSTSLNLGLGGPRFYSGTKVRYPRIGGITDPSPDRLLSAYYRIQFIGWFIWLAVFLTQGWFFYAKLA